MLELNTNAVKETEIRKTRRRNTTLYKCIDTKAANRDYVRRRSIILATPLSHLNRGGFCFFCMRKIEIHRKGGEKVSVSEKVYPSMLKVAERERERNLPTLPFLGVIFSKYFCFPSRVKSAQINSQLLKLCGKICIPFRRSADNENTLWT